MIRLLLDDIAEQFEQDIREMCRSFYPGESFRIEDSGGVHFAEMSAEEKKENYRRIEAEKAGEYPEKDTGRTESPSRDRGCTEEEGYTLSLTIDGRKLCRRKPEPDRRMQKILLKKALYRLLSDYTGRLLPWGNLTGIRPVTLLSPRLREEKEKSGAKRLTKRETERVLKGFQKEYELSHQKLKLIYDIAVREEELLQDLRDMTKQPCERGWSLYVGVPFCPTRCLYCSFTSNPIHAWEGEIDRYLGCLEEELDAVMHEMCELQHRTLQTVYIGGGTPTALRAPELRRLLELLKTRCFSHRNARVCEFCVEAGRPDSLDREKLRLLKEYRADRISINPQTFSQKTLDLIGRKHTVGEVIRKFRLARELGFENINMDIILGLPEEHLSEVTNTLRQIALLHPDSLTVHSLAVKRAARFSREKEYWEQRYRAGADMTLFPDLGEDGDAIYRSEMERMMALSEYTAEVLGLHPYYLYRQKNMAGNLENIGFAESGKECLYNILMMEEKHPVLGIGAGAATKVPMGGGRIERCDNGKDIRSYMENVGARIREKLQILRQLPEREET